MNNIDFNNLPVLLEQAGLRDDPAILALVNAALRSRNPSWKERLMKILSVRLANVAATHPYAPSPRSEDVGNGQVSVGKLLPANMEPEGPVNLPIEAMLLGQIILGATGSGKSAELFWICDQLSEFAKVWIFDREGDAPEKLAGALRSGKFKYIHYTRFVRNLIEPMRGETPRELMNRLLNYWRHELYLAEGAENILTECLNSVLEEHGVLAGGNDYPTLWHVAQRLQRMKSKLDARQRQYWESAWNRITGLLTLMGDVYDHKRGFGLEELLDENLVIDLQGISDSHHRFFVSDLLSCAMAIKERKDWQHINIFAIDELHRYARSGLNNQVPWEPFLFQVARLGRKRGMSTILSDQVPSNIPSPVMANMATRIVLRTINGPCKDSVGRSMGLSRDQKDWLSEMPFRTAVVHSVIYPSPFVVQIPEIEYEEPLSLQELRALEQDFLSQLDYETRETPEEDVPERKSDRKNESQRISKEILDYMVAVDSRPFINATQRDKELGLTPYKGDKLRKELEARELALLIRVSLGRRGKNIVLVELTSKAYEVFGEMNIKPIKHRGKGSIVHKMWQHRLQEYFGLKHPEWECVIEDMSTGKAVDVSVDTGEKRMAYEICINGVEKEIGNIARDDGYEEVVILAQDERTLSRVREKASAVFSVEELSHVSFELLSKYGD